MENYYGLAEMNEFMSIQETSLVALWNPSLKKKEGKREKV